MKIKKILFFVIAIVIISINFNSYAVTMPGLRITSNNYSAGDKMTLNEAENLEVGKTLQLYAIIGYNNGGVVPSPLDPNYNDFDFDSLGYYIIQTNLSGVTWTSSNTGIAVVDNTGKVTGVSEGEVTITAKYNDEAQNEKSATFELNIIKKIISEPIHKFKFIENTIVGNLNKYIINNEKNFSIYAAEEYTGNILYSIDNENVAKIIKTENNAATVRFVGAGNTTIRATLNYNGENLSDEYNFTVVNDENEFYDYQIMGDTHTIKTEKTTQLKLLEQYGVTSPKNVTSEANWTSDNEYVAKVDENGIVTGLHAGNTSITATYKKGSRTIVTKYEIKVEEDFTGLKISDQALTSTTSFVLNKEYGFGIYLYNIPDSEKENIKVTIDKENVAKITKINLCNLQDGSGNGKIIANVKFLSLGEFTITASLNYNGRTYTDSYTSKVIKSRYILTLSTKESDNLPENLEVGKTMQLNAILRHYDSTVTENITTNGVVWASSNEEIATVKNGLIVAKKEGKVTITATVTQNDEFVIETYNINITNPTKSSKLPDESKTKQDDPTVAKTTIPQTGENYIIINIAIALIAVLSIIMYRKYSKYKYLK